jgi:hypothetical protein
MEVRAMDLATLGLIFTAAVFGAFGWWRARKRRHQAGGWTFFFLLMLAAVGSGTGSSTRLLDILGFAVPLNWAIAASCLGGCLGLLVRNRELTRQKAGCLSSGTGVPS